jgi:hypothetical protein
MFVWGNAVDDRIEERRGGRHTRSKYRPSSNSFPSLLLLLFPKTWFTHRTAFPWATQNLQNMMGSIGEPGQAGDDVGGRKK